MKPEDHAWRALQDHAASQLRSGFANGVLRAANGPRPAVWRRLFAHGAEQLRPGFAARVLRAARAAADMPSLSSQCALSAVTAAACLAAILFFHQRTVDQADARNLAEWQRIAAVAEIDTSGL